MPSISLHPADFDSCVTGKRIATATVSRASDGGTNEQAFDLLCAKVPSDDFESIDVLNKNGFQYVEGEIDLEVNLETTGIIEDTTSLRKATLDDLRDLKGLASESMRGRTRLRSPWFTTEDSDKMYETWIENAVKGRYDHVCLVHTDEADRVTAFITIRWLNDVEGRIGLFAVSEESRKRGVGSRLFEHAKGFCDSSGRKKLFVATQTSNLAALRLYQRTGGQAISTAHWYYKKPGRASLSSTNAQNESSTAEQPGASVLSRPCSGQNSLEHVKEVLEHGSLAGNGKFTRKCEDLANIQGHDRILLTTSGTLALHIAALAIDLKLGDEVIMPTFTYVSTVNAFTMRGATPVFLDVDYTSMNMDSSLVEGAITPKTRALVVVHYAGVPCDMNGLVGIAQLHGLLVVEDAAQGLGSTSEECALGSMGDIGCLSFHGTKMVTSGGQGGAVIVSNTALLKSVQNAYWNGTNRADFAEGLVPEYTWIGPGFNSQMSEVLAALLYCQLVVLPELLEHNRRGYAIYYDRLSALAERGEIALPTPPSQEHNAHIFHIKVVDATQRGPLKRYLKERNIASEPHYAPLHSTPPGRSLGRYLTREDVASKAAVQLLRLPLHVGMTEREIDKAVLAIEGFFDGRSP
ncbi:hypothetical protein M409DRAFT_17025 [Zasmidium cellare ATCC 36951]|uniref:N-acetyltransferase domain-containing protein n=1 Tax=Zasmidium cellare ATCC 36951 TaxID=1080233 RepID=A0A6A6D0T5_ZASCE|nr:uncharacterized protein M409DRAFT_17025 [Zasmidium cellare ATCC 36951]KAF2173077.1 hypothetical protein M409DRAFT_17025 [Zasmidium cellare ATCC 36951]